MVPTSTRRWNNFAANHPPDLQAAPGQWPGSALANGRVQCYAAGRVVLKLKTPWRDGATHLNR